MKIIQDLSEAQLKALKVLYPRKYSAYIRNRNKQLKEEKRKAQKLSTDKRTMEITKAYKVAIEKYPLESKPEFCKACSKKEPEHRHHVVRLIRLYERGIHLNPDKHLCVWVCHECHELIHAKKISF